jgi:hypothetical protein
MLTLKQFLREATTDPQDGTPLFLRMTDFIGAFTKANFEEGRRVSVILDHPTYDSFTVHIFAEGEEPNEEDDDE